jgi:hypothetical protein
MEATILLPGRDSITCEGIDPPRGRAHPPARTSTLEEPMDRTALLRTTYRVNAAATFACAAALLGFGHLLAPLLGVPAVSVWGLGAFFVPFAAWIWAISRRPQLLPAEALAAGLLDGGYALASFLALAELWTRMTPELRFAIAFVATPVALFAAVELSAALRLRGSPAAA